MKIKLGDKDLAGSATLSESEFSSAYDIEISGQLNSQPRLGVRRKIAGMRDRGNLITTISFSTTRKFSTVAAAEEFALGFDEDFGDREGTLSTDTGYSMPNTLVLPPTRRVNGVSVMMRFTCVGGGFDPTPA